jgi:hypothetical protein
MRSSALAVATAWSRRNDEVSIRISHVSCTMPRACRRKLSSTAGDVRKTGGGTSPNWFGRHRFTCAHQKSGIGSVGTFA